MGQQPFPLCLPCCHLLQAKEDLKPKLDEPAGSRAPAPPEQAPSAAAPGEPAEPGCTSAVQRAEPRLYQLDSPDPDSALRATAVGDGFEDLRAKASAHIPQSHEEKLAAEREKKLAAALAKLKEDERRYLRWFEDACRTGE
jgi:hypothetical protein